MLHEDGSDEHEIEVKRLEMVRDILMIGNDIQLMAGVALMITGFASYHTIDLYHLRLIYDTVSFVGVSIAAALVCFTFCVAREEQYHQRRQRRATGLSEYDISTKTTARKKDDTWIETYFKVFGPLQLLVKWTINTVPQLAKLSKENPIIRKFSLSSRYRATYVFSVFYLALTILLNNKLGEWDLEVAGTCYNSHLTSKPGASHPQADRVYLWVTFGWMITVMGFAIFGNASHRRFILVAAFVQFPLHFYMMLALRSANQGLLGVTAGEAADASEAATRLRSRAESSEEATENEWDFGQTTAILLLFVALVEAFGKGYEFFKFERQLKKKQKEGPGSRQGSRGSSGIEFDDFQQQQQQGDGDERGHAERHEREENVPLNANNWKSSPREQIAHVDTVSSNGPGSAVYTGMPYDVESNAQHQHLPQERSQTLKENQHLNRRQ